METFKSALTNYICDGTNPASAVLADSNATYTPSLSERRSGTSKFLHSDALGTTRGITNSSQAATGTISHEAFGLTVATTGSSTNPYKFAATSGYRNYGDAGLSHVGARYYDAQVGRFITRDTELDQHPYLYCDHDPVNGVDPSGHDVGGGIIGGIMTLYPFPPDYSSSPTLRKLSIQLQSPSNNRGFMPKPPDYPVWDPRSWGTWDWDWWGPYPYPRPNE
jgi:RHS repeat-associated protein